MKRRFSIFSLAARFMFWPVVIISALCAAATLLLLQGAAAQNPKISDEELFGAALYPVTAGIIALTLLFTRLLRDRGGVQPGYTVRRLGVPELELLLLQTLAALLGYLVFLAAQTAALLGYGLRLHALGYGSAGELSVFIGLVLSRPGHFLLPLDDLVVLLREGLVLFMLAFSAAYASLIGRRGRTAVLPYVLLALGGLSRAYSAAPLAEPGWELLIILVCVIVIGSTAVSAVGAIRDDAATQEAEDYGQSV